MNIEKILYTMKSMFPNYKVELNFGTPFQLLVAVILSAQTTDKQVNKVTNLLFESIKTPEDVVLMWEQKLIDSIKSIWLYNSKWNNIYKLSKILVEKNLSFPCSLEEFEKFPWVGMKTAKVVMNILYDARYMPVDTHIHRVSNRLGLVKTKDPKQTSIKLEEILTYEQKEYAHIVMIFFGRYFCTAKNPKCIECPLNKVCNFYN